MSPGVSWHTCGAPPALSEPHTGAQAPRTPRAGPPASPAAPEAGNPSRADVANHRARRACWEDEGPRTLPRGSGEGPGPRCFPSGTLDGRFLVGGSTTAPTEASEEQPRMNAPVADLADARRGSRALLVLGSPAHDASTPLKRRRAASPVRSSSSPMSSQDSPSPRSSRTSSSSTEVRRSRTRCTPIRATAGSESMDHVRRLRPVP